MDGATTMSVAGLTHEGHQRVLNEDSWCIGEIGSASSMHGPEDFVGRLSARGGFVLGVFDGTGGTATGDFASATAARIVRESFATHTARDAEDLHAQLIASVTHAGAELYAEGHRDRRRAGMGSTATVAVISGEHLLIAQVGDSRAYVLRRRELVQVTRDDTLINEYLRAGALKPEDVASFPHKNVVLQALGVGRELRVTVTRIPLRFDDVLLLCTDGLGVIDVAMLRAVLLRHRAPGVAARVLLDEVLSTNAPDNLAFIVARFDGSYLAPPTADDVLEDRATKL